MKKYVFLIGVFCVMSLAAYAQTDDMYFVPSKASKEKKEQPLKIHDGSYGVSDEETSSLENYNDKAYTNAEIDAYNRRGYKANKDTLYIGDGNSETNGFYDNYSEDYNSNDYYYSNRLARFHEPTVNIYFGYGVPYWDWDYYYNNWAWGYNYAWNWGWNWYPGYYGWYGGWGWTYPWHYHCGWYDWGWSRPVGPGRPWHGSSWNGGRHLAGQTNYDKVGSAGGRIWGGGRNYRDAIERNGSTRGFSNNSRGFSDNGRNYGSSGRSNMSSRSFGSTPRKSFSNTGTRSMGSGSSGSFGGGSSRSFGSSSPSFGGGRSFGGGGGGRSFGGGRR